MEFVPFSLLDGFLMFGKNICLSDQTGAGTCPERISGGIDRQI